jgi:hypothetical protein
MVLATPRSRVAALATLERVSRKKPLTERGVKRMIERERSVGLDPDDPGAQWLAENDKQPAPPPPKSASKSKALHRWRNSRP